MVFAGSVGAGKTAAITTLSDSPPVVTEPSPGDTATMPMVYGQLTLADDTKLHLYGAPGGERFAFMNPILTKGALGLIVLVNNNAPSPLEEMAYYLDLNAEFLQSQSAVIGVTHWDVSAKPSLDDYAARLAERGEYWPVLRVDPRDKKDLVALADALLSVLEYG